MYTNGFRTTALSSIASLVLISTAGLVHAQSMRPNHIRGRLIVQHRAAADVNDDLAFLKGRGANAAGRIKSLRVTMLDLPEAAIDSLAKQFEKSGRFTFVERDFTARGALVPNDPSVGSQWHLSKIEAPAAWGLSTGSTAIPVAVVDSGVDSTHPDLAGKIIPGWNFLGNNTDTADVLGHGTAVAGSVGAATDNGVGVAGVGWNTPIMPLVVLNASDFASYSDVASAITYAADHGVRIINISISGSSASSLLQSAVDYAWNKGALVFAAAGNNGTNTPNYPAACNHAIAVSSTEPDDTLSSFSSYGSWITLSAPGNTILTTNRGGGYGQWYGTSFASPIAAGVAALAWSAQPALGRDALLSILQQSSDDLGAPGVDVNYGYGRVNAYRAVAGALANSPDVTAPVVTITAPAEGTSVTGTVLVTGTAADNVGVQQCLFYVDATLVGSSSAPFSFTWNSAMVANGPHGIKVRCSDAAGNAGSGTTSVQVDNVTLPDAQAPAVQILSPTAGSTLNGNQSTVTARATDNVGVTEMSLYIDGIQVSNVSGSSLSYAWSTKRATKGVHTIVIKAWDRAGNAGSSSIDVNR